MGEREKNSSASPMCLRCLYCGDTFCKANPIWELGVVDGQPGEVHWKAIWKKMKEDIYLQKPYFVCYECEYQLDGADVFIGTVYYRSKRKEKIA